MMEGGREEGRLEGKGLHRGWECCFAPMSSHEAIAPRVGTISRNMHSGERESNHI